MDSKFKAIYFALLMVTVSLAGCVSQDDYDAAIEIMKKKKPKMQPL